MDPASEQHLIRFARVLETLATKHGLSDLQLAGDGRIVADVAPDRTLLDIARFELEAQAVLHRSVHVISSKAIMAGQVATGPLKSASAA